jgi:DNA invertase Pin-like site-specific DNA recombinase
MNKKAVIYARVSTEAQAEEGFSLPSQIDACRSFAEQHEFEIFAEFSDDHSGRELERPGLDEVRKLIGACKVNALIVYSGDRLTRDVAHSILLRREREIAQVELYKVLGGQVEDSPYGRFTETVLSGVSELEAEIIVERTQRGKNRRAQEGHMILSGKTPYGYDKVGKGRDSTYVINDNEAKVVRTMFELYSTGNGSSPYSLRGLVDYLNSHEIPTPRHRKCRAKRWQLGTVQAILHNEIYAGRTYWGKTRVINKSRIKQPRERWIAIDVSELAIIERETFNQVQERFDKNRRLSKRNRKFKYLLSGYLRCGCCNRGVYGWGKKRKTEEYYFYYRCSTRWVPGKEKHCDYHHKDTPVKLIDNAVWNWLTELLVNRDALEAGINAMIDAQNDDVDPLKNRLNTLDSLISESDVKIQRLVTEIAKHDDEIVLSAIREEIHKEGAIRTSLIDDKNNIEAKLRQVEISKDEIDQALFLASEICSGRIEEATFENKRRLLDLFDVQVTLWIDENEKWLDVSCAIPQFNGIIALCPSRRTCTQMTFRVSKNLLTNPK